MLRNALDAARASGARFVYFDNTYMYPQDDRLLTENAPFEPVGRKGQVRAQMASMVLQEMERGDIAVVIGRAPEFYGPGKTQSITNTLVIDNIKVGKSPAFPSGTIPSAHLSGRRMQAGRWLPWGTHQTHLGKRGTFLR